jgi:D-amino-acid dehydrogenase
MQSLASYSFERLTELSKTLELSYDRAEGYMTLLRSEQDLEQMRPSLQVLKDVGYEHSVLDATAARKTEPALSLETTLHAAIYLPNDAVANCRQFALLLRTQAEALGAKFHFNRPAGSLIQQGLQGIHINFGNDIDSESFDQVVVCAGVDSAALLKPLGVHLPLIPVYGYSVSAPIREPMDAPVSGVMDERFKVAISRIGNRVRVAGGAQIGGDASKMNESAIQTLYKVLGDWFPGAADTKNQVQVWKGARPMLPGGPPRVGASGVQGVWLNLGHGSSGWALSCGSARLLADKISGKKPTIDF